jgi:competence protein ComEA
MKRRTNWMIPMGVMLAVAIAATLALAPGVMADKAGTSLLVNINTAEQGELVTLPGIGISKADAIVAYRSEHGSFSTIDELTKVRGIGSNVLEKIRHLIKIQ